MHQFENIGLQPINLEYAVTTFLILVITGKVFKIYLSRSSSGMECSTPQKTEIHQFENIGLKPINLGNVVTTFLSLFITGKVFNSTFPEVLPVWYTSYTKRLKCINSKT